MKRLLILLALPLLFAYSCYAQDEKETDCESIIIIDYDKVTGKTSTRTNTIVISNNDKKIYMCGYKHGKVHNSLAIIIDGFHCIDNDSKINILFRDGSRSEMKHDGKYNCDSRYLKLFGGNFGSEPELKMLSTKEIEIIRILTTKTHYDIVLMKQESVKLMQSMNCISN